MKDAPIEMTKNELFYISDALSHQTHGPSPDSKAYPDLLLRIGAGLLECMENSKELITITFTEDEVWMIRDISKTGIMIGNERVGLNLLIKCYTSLRGLCADESIHTAVVQVGETAIEDQSSHDVQKKLDKWKEKKDGDRNARKSNNPSNANDSPSD